jgi:hypothetical protein
MSGSYPTLSVPIDDRYGAQRVVKVVMNLFTVIDQELYITPVAEFKPGVMPSEDGRKVSLIGLYDCFGTDPAGNYIYLLLRFKQPSQSAPAELICEYAAWPLPDPPEDSPRVLYPGNLEQPLEELGYALKRLRPDA